MIVRYLGWLTAHWPTILAAASIIDVAVWLPILYVLHRNRRQHPLT